MGKLMMDILAYTIIQKAAFTEIERIYVNSTKEIVKTRIYLKESTILKNFRQKMKYKKRNKPLIIQKYSICICKIFHYKRISLLKQPTSVDIFFCLLVLVTSFIIYIFYIFFVLPFIIFRVLCFYCVSLLLVLFFILFI